MKPPPLPPDSTLILVWHMKAISKKLPPCVVSFLSKIRLMRATTCLEIEGRMKTGHRAEGNKAQEMMTLRYMYN